MDKESESRWKLYREFVSDHFGEVDFVNDATHFSSRIDLPVLVPHNFGTVHSTPHLVQTTRAAARRNQSEFVRVVIPRAGEVLLEQGDRRVALEPGRFAIYDAMHPVSIGARKDYSSTMLSLPRALVAQSILNLRDLTAVSLDQSVATSRVFLSLVFELEQVGAELGASGLDSYMSTLASTLAVALGTVSNTVDDNSALLKHLMVKMDARIRDPELRLEDIAMAEGISTRGIRRAFQQAGATPWGWVIEKRLQGVAHDLRVTGFATRSVTDIAFSWGFNNISHFGRAFRKRFGVSPTEWRHAVDPSAARLEADPAGD